jgi:hypothetical protein
MMVRIGPRVGVTPSFGSSPRDLPLDSGADELGTVFVLLSTAPIRSNVLAFKATGDGSKIILLAAAAFSCIGATSSRTCAFGEPCLP